jgi:hypothetical protein
MIEIIPEPGEKLKPVEKKVDNQLEMLMSRWRESEFYDWVNRIIDDEISIDYSKDAMFQAYAEGESLSDGQIARLSYGQFISEERIRKIKETLK